MTELVETGYTVLKAALPVPTSKLVQWADEVFALGMLGEGRHLDSVWHHYENVDSDDKTVLTRSENFASLHEGMKSLLLGADAPLAKIVSAVLGKPVTLYKEKINYKQPGGSGYVAHQDAPAYHGISQHITCLLPIDPMDETNGCLEFSGGKWDGLLPTTDDGVIEPDVARKLNWAPVPAATGDVLIFSSFVPHKSQPNTSQRPRRALYLTFNAVEDGDLRTEYYQKKATEMHHNRLSLINHFQGSLVVGAQEVTAAVRELFRHRGSTMYDPQVTQLEHALQSAQLALAQYPDDDEIITATLLHDVGHLILDEHDSASDFLKQDLEHEKVGKAFLVSRFSERVAGMVEHHVDAKRYLCGKDSSYYDGLSDASKRSLALQGGAFSPTQCREFETRPYAMDAVKIRLWDDCAKTKGRPTPPLDTFLPHVQTSASRVSVAGGQSRL